MEKISGFGLEIEIRWKKYQSRLKRFLADGSADALHDFRVATRRILTLTHLLFKIERLSELKVLEKIFKAKLGVFGELRDVQVTLGYVTEYMTSEYDVTEFIEYLQEWERTALHVLQKELHQKDHNEISALLSEVFDNIETHNAEYYTPKVLHVIDKAFAKVKQRQELIDIGDASTIHSVRIAFKTFRYMLEIASLLIPNYPETHHKHLNDYQSLMGEIQDSSVFVKVYREYCERTNRSPAESIIMHCESRQIDALAGYVASAHHIDVFWRKVPDAPFPWA